MGSPFRLPAKGSSIAGDTDRCTHATVDYQYRHDAGKYLGVIAELQVHKRDSEYCHSIAWPWIMSGVFSSDANVSVSTQSGAVPLTRIEAIIEWVDSGMFASQVPLPTTASATRTLAESASIIAAVTLARIV